MEEDDNCEKILIFLGSDLDKFIDEGKDLIREAKIACQMSDVSIFNIHGRGFYAAVDDKPCIAPYIADKSTMSQDEFENILINNPGTIEQVKFTKKDIGGNPCILF